MRGDHAVQGHRQLYYPLAELTVKHIVFVMRTAQAVARRETETARRQKRIEIIMGADVSILS